MSARDWLEIIILAALLLMGILIFPGCTSTNHKSFGPLTSLCIMDYTAKMCWVNKAENKGVSFDQMREDQEMCFNNNESFPCWYGINRNDLRQLNE